MQKTPYLLIEGDKEVDKGTVSIRGRGAKDLGSTSLKKFVLRLNKEIENHE
jgi:threonyl-tRNA synthetase